MVNTANIDSSVYKDADIIAEVLSGNTALFEVLIRRYNPYIYKVGRGYGFNHQDTEDLMQETFVSSYINLRQFNGRASIKTWLITIMLHHCYHKVKRKAFQKEMPTEVLPENASFMFSQNNHSDNSKTVINRELSKVIEACLQRLPEDYRTTFTLRELTGLNVSETAALMDTTAANVKVRLNRAKAMLRKEIERTYTAEDIYEFNLVYCDRIVSNVMQRIDALGDIHQSGQSRPITERRAR
jgi:RNA polymerase sigma-70 factor (ECF subfamily)